MRYLAALVLGGCVPLPAPAVYPGVPADRTGFFVVYGDTRRFRFGEDLVESARQRQDAERREVARRIAADGPDFILHSGDLVKNGGDREEWAVFDQDTAEARAKGIAFFPALGNHDYEGEGVANYFRRFPHLRGRKWYDLDYRGVLILVLDSNRSYLSRDEIEAQGAWYRERLARAQADANVRCAIVVCHHAPYTNAAAFNDSEFVQREFVAPARSAPKVRAFFTGHIHSYERFEIDGIHHVVSGGGGAPVNGVRPGLRHRDRYTGPRRFHYCRVRVGETVDVEVEMLAEDRTWFRAETFRIHP